MSPSGDYSTNKSVIVREVWASNLTEEFALIRGVANYYPLISMDTEFPGTIILSDQHYSRLSPSDNYSLMKANVDALNLIQVGLTLSDAYGNLPNFDTDYSYVWEFNFRDFDIDADLCNPDSIDLLKRQGIDFKKNSEEGIDSRDFAEMLLLSGLVWNSPMTWVTFHSAYDFGFLIKILTQRELPEDLPSFMAMVNVFFGGSVYDIKHLIRYCNGLYGGLERVASTLGVYRAAGKSHQAGSDSLLTMHTFLKLRERFRNGVRKEDLKNMVGYQFEFILYGLEFSWQVEFLIRFGIVI